MTQPSQIEPATTRNHQWRWMGAFAILAGLHFAVVWWCATHTSSGFWVMEGSSKTTPTEVVAEILTLVLNFPLGWAGMLTHSGVFRIAGVVANSLLWATCGCGVVWIGVRSHRYKRSVYGTSKFLKR